MKIIIEKLTKHEIWPMRHKIMYPDQPFDSIKLTNDDEGIHVGLFANEKLVSVVSLFLDKNKIQFRKLATEIEEQGKGYGSKLLNYAFELAKELKTDVIWCNARANKTDFYKKFGMVETNQTYVKLGINFVIMEKIIRNT